MSCFYHLDHESVGSCKCCGKDLCPDCAVDLGKGLACRGRCEEDVQALIRLIERNVKLSATVDSRLKSNQRAMSSAAIFNLIIGGIFLAWGLADGFTFIIVLGVCFLAYGAYGLFRWRTFGQKMKPPGT